MTYELALAAAHVAVWTIGGFLFTAAYYVLAMKMFKRFGRVWWMWLVVGPFLLCDFLANVFIITLWFLELPREFLVTSRLKRWRLLAGTPFNRLSKLKQRRLLFAVWLCDGFLDKYDTLTGDHC